MVSKKIFTFPELDCIMVCNIMLNVFVRLFCAVTVRLLSPKIVFLYDDSALLDSDSREGFQSVGFRDMGQRETPPVTRG